MLLTDQERARFADYLRQDARSNRLIAEQLAGMPVPAMAVLARRKEAEAAAEELVAAMLRSAESAVITSGSEA